MQTQVMLSDRERELLVELLREERGELPSEIRRTDTPRYHDDLQGRLKIVEDLIDRLEKATTV